MPNYTMDQALDSLRARLGVDFSSHNPVLTTSDREYTEKFLFAFNNRHNQNALVGDADVFTYNPASSGVPYWATLVNLNKVVEQLLPVRAYGELSEPFQQGDFTTDTVYYVSVGLNGKTEAYDDFSTDGQSDVNSTYPTRDIYRAQTNFQYGTLEVEKAAKVNLDLVAQKQFSAAMNMAIAQNKLFFYGNINAAGAFIGKTFGLLNDPQLNPAVPATDGGSGSPLWSVKFQSPTGARDIANDVLVTAWRQLMIQMGGNVRLDDELTLVCSTSAAAYLNTPNEFGLNPTVLIKNTMSNLKIVFAPEYAALGSFQLIATRTMGENLIKDLFTTKIRAFPLIPQASSFHQKYAFGSGGCAILQYAPIVTVSGIE